MADLATDDSLFGAHFTSHTGHLGERLTSLVEACGNQPYVDSLGSAVRWSKSDIDKIDEGDAAPTRASLEAFLKSARVVALGTDDDRVSALWEFLEETAEDPDEPTTMADDGEAGSGDEDGVSAPAQGDSSRQLIVWKDPGGDGKGTVIVDGTAHEIQNKGENSIRQVFVTNLRRNREADGMTVPELSEKASTFMPKGETLPTQVIGNMWNHMTFLNQRRAEAYAQALGIDVAGLLGVPLDRIAEVNKLRAAEEPEAEEPEAEEPEAEEPEAEEPEAEENDVRHEEEVVGVSTQVAVPTETERIRNWLLERFEGGRLPPEVGQELMRATLKGIEPDYPRLLVFWIDSVYPDLMRILQEVKEDETLSLCLDMTLRDTLRVLDRSSA